MWHVGGETKLMMMVTTGPHHAGGKTKLMMMMITGPQQLGGKTEVMTRTVMINAVAVQPILQQVT